MIQNDNVIQVDVRGYGATSNTAVRLWCPVCGRDVLAISRSWRTKDALFEYFHFEDVQGERRPPCFIRRSQEDAERVTQREAEILSAGYTRIIRVTPPEPLADIGSRKVML